MNELQQQSSLLWAMATGKINDTDQTFYIKTVNVGTGFDTIWLFAEGKEPLEIRLNATEITQKTVISVQIYDLCHKQKAEYSVPYSGFLNTFSIFKAEEYFILRKETDRDITSTFVGKSLESAIAWITDYWKEMKDILSDIQRHESGAIYTEYCNAVSQRIGDLESLKKRLQIQAKNVQQTAK